MRGPFFFYLDDSALLLNRALSSAANNFIRVSELRAIMENWKAARLINVSNLD